MEQQVLAWITQYGYLAIFSLLVLGIVGLPVPDETLLTFTGYLVYQGHLSLTLALLSGFAGSVCGITLSYILGRTFGLTLIHRYGRYLHIRQHHVEKAHAWFQKAGHWSLTFGYYIPGVRHFTAYAAGMSCLEYPPFALFAYSGAALWVSSFIGLGYLLGERWKSVEENIHQYMLGATIAIVILALGYLVWRKWFRAKRT
ncbi:MAG: alkaline phosphatase, DedA family [Candidatus Solibacter sp.]|jgi:membrane protein DedA with SNARE-associated domain|nr:alkaline phosphatase, DedA family [Candidatus Solibacter sp.]